MKQEIASVIFAAILVALILIFGGAIYFGIGYFGGWLLKCIVGQPVTEGLNMVLGNITQYTFTPDDIPIFCAIMTTISGFFKSYTSTSKEK